MTDSQLTTLVLGGTGRTGSLVTQRLIERGLNVRTASRHGADVLFDWDDPTTHARALDGVDRVYLVTPVMRVKYAGLVSDFLDLAGRPPISFQGFARRNAAGWTLQEAK